MNVLIVDDDDTLRDLLGRELGRSGHAVRTAASGGEGLARIAESEPDAVLLDLMLPDMSGMEVLRQVRASSPAVQVIVLTAHGSVDTALAAVRLGAYDYLQKPCHLEDLELTLERAQERARLGEENARLRDGLNATGEPALVGCGKPFAELKRFIGKIAESNTTVLVRGETGTGKEMVARSIHRQSARRNRPFVVVDCAALQENLLQSELFGHEKGAFTGAAGFKHGLFEIADKGTLFLDEIGDVSPAVQAALLRALETSTFRRVGGTRELTVDVRLIAATNRDLERLIRAGQFRQDLYFRLNTIHIQLPPLRRSTEQIPCLVEHFVAAHNGRFATHKQIDAEVMQALSAYHWPGNARELRHVVERMIVLAESDRVGWRDLPSELRRVPAAAQSAPPVAPASRPLRLADVERQHIEQVLAEVGGHRSRAAELLGISERSLYRKLHEYGLEAAEPDAVSAR